MTTSTITKKCSLDTGLSPKPLETISQIEGVSATEDVEELEELVCPNGLTFGVVVEALGSNLFVLWLTRSRLLIF